jgi:tRNA-dihydrouridine synthase A
MNRKISIAPMMDCTDRHYRYLMRLITKHTLLYTEMVTTGALIHGDRDRWLHYHPQEHPIALQLGGSNSQELALCARFAEDYGYDEVNLNIGCPSDRVQSGRIGACLMAEPELVADCVAAMFAATKCPVTVKTRIGIDNRDSYEELYHFITTVHQAGCQTFIIHARKAWLNGLSPKENRSVPPLQYPIVYKLKQDFPQIEIIINGGITTLEDIETHLQHVDGVMIGREAYANPYLLAEIEEKFYPSRATIKSRHEILEEYLPYIQQQLTEGNRLNLITRHLLGLYQGLAGAKRWRTYLTQHAINKDKGIEVVRAAQQFVLS